MSNIWGRPAAAEVTVWLLVLTVAANATVLALMINWAVSGSHLNPGTVFEWEDSGIGFLCWTQVYNAVGIWRSRAIGVQHGSVDARSFAFCECTLGALAYLIIFLLSGQVAAAIATCAVNALPLVPLLHPDTADWCR